MGLFSGSSKTYVASTPYNMAGPQADRINYLKSTVTRSVLTGSSSIADDIVYGQIQGPALDQLNFMRWSKKYFDKGRVSGTISGYRALNTTEMSKVAPILTVPSGMDYRIETAFVDDADIEHFARKYMFENYPDLINTAWVSDFIHADGDMKIFFENGDVNTIPMPDFDPSADYVYVFYNLVEGEVWEPVVQGSLVTNLDNPPSLTGPYSGMQEDTLNVTGPLTVTLNTTVTVTDDKGSGSSTSTITTTSREESVETYHQRNTNTVHFGIIDNRIVNEFQILNIWKRYEVINTTTSSIQQDTPETGTTRTTTEENESIRIYYEYRLDTQKVIIENAAQKRVAIYKIGDGNADLDALVNHTETLEEFFPIILLRRYGTMIDQIDTSFPDIKKAYRKAIGQNISSTLQSIKENPDVGDIDHAFLTFGVEINTEDMHGRRYIYEFFRRLMQNQDSGAADYVAWRDAGMPSIHREYLDWVKAQQNPNNVLYGTPMPKDRIAITVPSENRISIKCTDKLEENLSIPFHYQIIWTAIDEKIKAGLGKPDAEEGELWWEIYDSDNLVEDAIQEEDDNGASWNQTASLSSAPISYVRLFWQETENSHRFLDIYGARHLNKVYDGKSVKTYIAPIMGGNGFIQNLGVDQGITDPETSGFIIPLHEDTLKKLRITDRNELAISNRIIIFNSYEVVKKKWWQSGFWSVVFAIVIAVTVAIVFPGAGGLLGANLSIGTAAGFAGVTAIIAGAVANAVAAIVLTIIIEKGSSAIFGDDWGKLIAALAMMVMGNMFSNMQTTGNFAVNWSQLTRAENLLNLTSAVLQGTRGFVESRIEGIGEDLDEIEKIYQEQLEEIEGLFEELGYSGAFINPIELFTEEQDSSRIALESSATFLRRTLLTGSDISQLSLSMIDHFPDVSLALPEAIE